MSDDDQPKPDLNEPFAGHFRPGTQIAQNWPWNKTFDGKPFGQGQCSSCGFLSRRSIDRAHPGVEEVPIEDRHEGQFFFTTAGSPSVPWCLVYAADLPSEVQAWYDLHVRLTANATNPAPAESIFAARDQPKRGRIDARSIAAMQTTAAQRHCPEWFPYREFHSPVEHRQERDMMRLEEDRKAHQTRLTEMELEVHRGSQAIAESLKGIAGQTKDIAEQTKAIHEANQATSKRTDDFMRNWTKAAVIVGVVALAVVLLTYLFPELGHNIGERIDQFLGYPLGRG